MAPSILRWKGHGLKEIWKQIQLQDPSPPVVDLMLMAYTVKAGNIGSFEEVYQQYIGEEIPTGAQSSIEAHIELESLLRKKLEYGDSILQDIELPLIPVLFEIEKQGMCLDIQQLEEQGKDLEKDIKKLEKSIHQIVGENFNISSPQQLAEALFNKMGLPPGKKTKTRLFH